MCSSISETQTNTFNSNAHWSSLYGNRNGVNNNGLSVLMFAISICNFFIVDRFIICLFVALSVKQVQAKQIICLFVVLGVEQVKAKQIIKKINNLRSTTFISILYTVNYFSERIIIDKW